MKILNIKWKNFGSYGNNEQEIIFDESNSLNLLYGSNGAGKSTVRNVIEFAIYGKVVDKTLKQLINRTNKKGLEVYVKIEVNSRIIEITRGISPTKLEVIVDNNDISTLAGKSNIQDYLETEIFKIPFNVFNNLISLNINTFKSFIVMSPKDKRNIIDNIFGLSMLNTMNELLKKEIKTVVSERNDIVNNIRIINNKIEKSITVLENLLANIKSKDEEKINELKKSLKKYKNAMAKCESIIAEQNSLIEKENEKRATINEKYTAVERSVYLTNQKLKLFENNQCPTCGTSLDSDFFKNQKNELLDKLNNFNTILEKLDKAKNKIKEDIAELSIVINENNAKINKISNVNYSIITEIKSLSEKDETQETTSIKKIIDDDKLEIIELEAEKEKKDNEMLFFDIVSTLLGDNGIKKTAMDSILPIINHSISLILSEFNLNFSLKFDNNFESILTSGGEIISPSTVSSGEMKKLDFSVILSIIKLMKYKLPGLNILFLDEIFSSLDIDTINNIINLLSDMSKTLFLHIFVVHHSTFDTYQFNNFYEMEKSNGFTQIKRIKSEY